jgi:NAD-dependent DNA ligase
MTIQEAEEKILELANAEILREIKQEFHKSLVVKNQAMSILASNFDWDKEIGRIDSDRLKELCGGSTIHTALEVESDRTGNKIVFIDTTGDGNYHAQNGSSLMIRIEYFPFRTSSDLVGKHFVITGILKYNRNSVANFITAARGFYQNSVSSATDYLICGDNVGMTKKRAAESKGIRIVDGEKFVEFIDKCKP